MADPTVLADAPQLDDLCPPQPADEAEDAYLADELLVEEISIDGMCGVY